MDEGNLSENGTKDQFISLIYHKINYSSSIMYLSIVLMRIKREEIIINDVIIFVCANQVYIDFIMGKRNYYYIFFANLCF